ncbi:MAG: ABC transporter substrate-binding protein [Candidatus Binatia bacterium]
MSSTAREPYRIGVMVDIPLPGLADAYPEACRFALEEAVEERLLDRPVEVIVKVYPGSPWGLGQNNRDVYLDLVRNHKVLAISGPMTTDNCLTLLDLVDAERVPVVTICGAHGFGGRYAFNLSNGNLADEPAFIAAWLASRGHRKIAVLRDHPSKIGTEYHRFLEHAAQIHGLDLCTVANITPQPGADETTAALARLKAATPDAIVYLGLGEANAQLNVALAKLDWWPPRIMCTAFVAATLSEKRARDVEGWYGIDQYDERNPRFRDMLARYVAKKGKALVANSIASTGYDGGRCLALALSRMPLCTPEALAEALETIRLLPSMTGGVGTYVSFGPWDHRGFKGLDYLCIRRSVDGKTELESG